MTTKVTGRSLFYHTPEPAPKEESKTWVSVAAQNKITQSAKQPKPESKKQVTILEQAKISEQTAPASVSDDRPMVSYSASVSFEGRPLKDIKDDDIWSSNDPWFQEMQKSQSVLHKLPGRSSTCDVAKLDWSQSE